MADITAYSVSLLSSLVTVCGLIGIYGLLFIPLERIFYVEKQPIIRKNSAMDAAYWFISLFIQAVFAALSLLIHGFMLRTFHEHPHAVISASLPVWAQVLCYLFIADVIQYWIHRAMHHEPLWGVHAVHHSSEELDWLVAYRRHPIEKSFLLLYGLLFLPTPETAAAVILVAPFFTYLPHANLNWTFGPLKYVLVSPIMHRWHHTHPAEGGMKNFATIFSCIDILFGTFYIPKNSTPRVCATTDRVIPRSIWAQLVYPFIQTASKDK